jgi:hypothetical protein
VVAICYWFGVNDWCVWRWRKALGVERFNEGSAKLHAVLNAHNAAKLRGKPLPLQQVERMRAAAKGRRAPLHPGGRPWTAKELRLLGTVPDAELAARIGRTEKAVRVMRRRRGIPNAADGRRREHRRRTIPRHARSGPSA